MVALKRTMVEGSVKTKLGGYLIQDALKAALANLDDSAHGGAVLLGVQSAVIKAMDPVKQRRWLVLCYRPVKS